MLSAEDQSKLRLNCEVWLKYQHNRTECCGADMHESCQKDQCTMHDHCSICQVPIKQGQPRLRAVDYTNMCSQQNKINGTKINTTLCHPPLVMQQQHHHHNFAWLSFLFTAYIGVVVNFALPLKLLLPYRLYGCG